MTGEITLQGRVLPIGGVKQKVLAAQRAGLTTVILPARNDPDLDDVPEAVRDADDVPSRGGRQPGPGLGAAHQSQLALSVVACCPLTGSPSDAVRIDRRIELPG